VETLLRRCARCGAAAPTDPCPSCGASATYALPVTPPADAFPHSAAWEVAQPWATELRARLQLALGGGWQIGRMLGCGGFSYVFVARELRSQREAAIKVLDPATGEDHALERFQREAAMLARVRHPNLIRVYHVGERDGLAWFTMPLLGGERLSNVLQREATLPIGECRRIVGEMAAALAALHRVDVVHRDVKPDNVMLVGDRRFTILMDLGAAKPMRLVSVGRLTAKGMLVGTPQYMSPEQAAAEGRVDHLADQYSLALVAYQMLAGWLPFCDGPPQAIAFRRLVEVPPPVQQRRAGVPPEMAAALRRALAIEPRDRFASITEFAHAFGGGAPAMDAPAAAGWHLVVVDGPDAGRAHGLRHDRAIVIGRATEVDVPLAGDEVASRMHCRVRAHADGPLLEDLASLNGTFVNGERVERAILRLGDAVRCGRTTLVVHSSAPVTSTPASPRV
jgi:hypothetical protein